MNKIKLLVIGLLLSTTFTMFAQQTVKGVVKEKTTGDTLPGVSVIIKGTTNGSETDFDGRFQISNVKSGDVLVFRSLGYSEKQDSVTVPMHSPDGMCLGFVARTIEGKDFKNTPGLPKGKILFNLHRVKSSGTVYVVESSFDAIRLDQIGFPAVATLGANVSNSQTRLLEKYFTNVVLIADNDEAGSIMKDKLIEKLGSLITVIRLDKNYKDIGDMEDAEIKKLEFQFDKSISSMLN